MNHSMSGSFILLVLALALLSSLHMYMAGAQSPYAQQHSLAYQIRHPNKDCYADTITHAIPNPVTNPLRHSHQNPQLHFHLHSHLHPQPFSILDPQQICHPLALQSAHSIAHEVGHSYGLFIVQPFADSLRDRHPIEDCRALSLFQLHSSLVELAFPFLSASTVGLGGHQPKSKHKHKNK